MMKRSARIHAFYTAAFLSAHLLLLGTGIWLWDRWSEAQHIASIRNQVEGPHALLAAHLATLPRTHWTQALATLQSQFGYPLRLQPLREVAQTLPRAQNNLLEQGLIVLGDHATFSHQRLPGSDLVLTLGDFEEATAAALGSPATETAELWALLLVMMAAIMLPLHGMVHRFWRDVTTLEAAIERLRRNDVHTPSPLPATRLLKPLGTALADAASQMQALLEGQRLMGQAMTHEIRTPLSRLKFSVDLLEEGPHGQDPLLQELRLDIEQLEALVQAGAEYLRFGRLPIIERHRIAIRPLIEAALPRMQGAAPPVITIRAAHNIIAQVNEAALLLALRNLLCNAARYAHGQINADAIIRDGWLLLRVDDDGPGFPEHLRHHAFDPYVRGAGSNGFGLGLAMVQAIAHKHGGEASIIASDLGGGCVLMRLPLDSRTTRQTASGC